MDTIMIRDGREAMASYWEGSSQNPPNPLLQKGTEGLLINSPLFSREKGRILIIGGGKFIGHYWSANVGTGETPVPPSLALMPAKPRNWALLDGQ